MEQVLSWQVTSEMLEAWGFPLQRTDKCVGTKVVIAEGMTFGKALHAAWAAGHVRMAALPEAERERQLAEFHAGIAEMRREAQESLAFLRKHGLIVGPSHNA